MIFDRRRYWLPLLLVTFLAGCSGKGDGDAKKTDDAKIMDREERPPNKKDSPTRKDGDPKPDEEKPPERVVTAKVTGKEIGEEVRDDVEKVKQKYHGKILEVTALVEEIGLNATGGAYLLVAGQEVPVSRQIEFVMSDPEPWDRVVPGQTATLKARCEILGGELRFKDGTVMEAKGPGRLSVTAAELASGFGKDPTEAAEKYGDHYVDVSGEAARIESAAGKELVRVTLKTPIKVLVSCEFTGEASKPLRIKQGDAVKVFGRVSGYNAAQGVELKGCILYTKP